MLYLLVVFCVAAFLSLLGPLVVRVVVLSMTRTHSGSCCVRFSCCLVLRSMYLKLGGDIFVLGSTLTLPRFLARSPPPPPPSSSFAFRFFAADCASSLFLTPFLFRESKAGDDETPSSKKMKTSAAPDTGSDLEDTPSIREKKKALGGHVPAAAIDQFDHLPATPAPCFCARFGCSVERRFRGESRCRPATSRVGGGLCV